MGHTTIDCYHKMDFAFQGKHPPPKLAAMAFSSNASTSYCWVSDTGATYHFTPDLANLQQPKDYNGNDGVTVGNGQNLPITHIGNTQLKASKHIFHLIHTLRVLHMKSNLLSVFRCCKDNNCSFHFDASKFSIQDIPSRKVLYKGLNEASLYPIYGDIFKHKSPPSVSFKSAFNSSVKSSSISFKSAFHFSVKSGSASIKASSSTWHSRLGHPHSKILHAMLHNLLVQTIDTASSPNSFCKYCALGKMT